MSMRKGLSEYTLSTSTQRGACLMGIRGNFARYSLLCATAHAGRLLKLLWHDSRSAGHGKLADCAQQILAITSRSKWLRSATGTITIWVK